MRFQDEEDESEEWLDDNDDIWDDWAMMEEADEEDGDPDADVALDEVAVGNGETAGERDEELVE